MIVTVFLNFVDLFISGLLGFLPTGYLPSGIESAILYFWGALNSFSYIFPVATLLEALLFVLAFDLALLLWHLVQWLIKRIPTQS